MIHYISSTDNVYAIRFSSTNEGGNPCCELQIDLNRNRLYVYEVNSSGTKVYGKQVSLS